MKRAEKNYVGFGIAHKVEPLGVVEETWLDGEVHQVDAYRGVDRWLWVRLKPNPGFAIGRLHWCKRYGSGRH